MKYYGMLCNIMLQKNAVTANLKRAILLRDKTLETKQENLLYNRVFFPISHNRISS